MPATPPPIMKTFAMFAPIIGLLGDFTPRVDLFGLGQRAMKILAKRRGPDPVEAVVINGVRFEAIHFGDELGVDQNGGYVVAYDENTNARLWILKVYETKYDPKWEKDVQDTFITSLGNSGGKLKVVNERDRRFLVDIVSKKIERIK